jgi:hypothetical protein
MVEEERFVNLRSIFRIIILSLTLSLITRGFSFEFNDEPDFNLSNRSGNVNVGGSMTLSSLLGSTTMEFGSSS